MEMNWMAVSFAAAALLVPSFPIASTTRRAATPLYTRKVPKDAIYLKDNSDWWSPARREGDEPTAEDEALFDGLRNKKPVPRDLGKFSIFGVQLASHEADDWLREIERRLGEAKIV